MICFPNAKINLGLNIVARRNDGYHDIETVFYPIPLADALEITPAESFSFVQTGIEIDAEVDSNLVVKAMRLLYPAGLPPFAVHLYKAIPFGAGLGGGSSDAAFMLKMLNKAMNLQLSDDEMEEKASQLGADCSFFVRNKPTFASGKGNIFEPIDLSLQGYHIVLVKPAVAVSTAAAYSGLIPRRPEISLRETVKRPVAEWKNLMTNDFEDSIFARHPEIGNIKERLYSEGALYASMSGSGSSVFGIFDREVEIKAGFGENAKLFQLRIEN